MEHSTTDHQTDLLRNMKGKIEKIERLTVELQALGKGIPAVENNAQSILSFTHVLRFGISDLVEG